MPKFNDKPDGIYPDMPMDEYLGLPRLSASGCHTLVTRCPAAFHYEQTADDSDSSAVTEIGKAAHILALEPHRWAEKVALIDFDDWRKKAAQEAREQALANDMIPLNNPQAETVLGMHEALKAEIGDQLAGGQVERTLLWTLKAFGVGMRSRPDWTAADDRRIVDYKTTGNAAARSFRSRVLDNGHHIQAAMCIEAHGLLTGRRADWWWLVQETEAPYLPAIYRPTEPWLAVGRELFHEAAETFARCCASGQWPGYLAGRPEDLEPPGWMVNEHMARTEARHARAVNDRAANANRDLLKVAADMQRPL